MYESAPRSEQRAILPGPTVVLVLADRVPDGLGVIGLQLQRDDRDAIGQQYDVEGLVRRRVEADLSQDA